LASVWATISPMRDREPEISADLSSALSKVLCKQGDVE